MNVSLSLSLFSLSLFHSLSLAQKIFETQKYRIVIHVLSTYFLIYFKYKFIDCRAITFESNS